MNKAVYALITGAGSGIGKALALECAARKFNVLLVSLPGENLAHLCCFIKKQYGVKADYLEMNLLEKEAPETLVSWCAQQGYAINMLINNAGIGSTGSFEHHTAAVYERQIQLNLQVTCKLTYLLLGCLKAHAPAHILNVGSLGGFYIIPQKSVYIATKTFIHKFSLSLREELMHKGINVSLVCPGPVNTNEKVTQTNSRLSPLARASVMEPQQVAHAAIEGMLKNKGLIIPGRLNKLGLTLSSLTPAFIKKAFINRTFEGVRYA